MGGKNHFAGFSRLPPESLPGGRSIFQLFRSYPRHYCLGVGAIPGVFVPGGGERSGKGSKGVAFFTAGEVRLDLRRKPVPAASGGDGRKDRSEETVVSESRAIPAMTTEGAGSTEGAKAPVRRNARTV